MINWPDKTLIRIKRGLKIQEEIRDELAIRNTNGNYVTQKHALYSTGVDNVIDDWEEVTAVPTAALEEFKAAWKGFGMYDPDDSQRVNDAITTILSYLPADKPSALDQAVTRAKDMGGPFFHAETIPAERLSIILDALVSIQGTTRKAVPLAMIARISADWIQADNPEKEALEQMRRRAASIPAVVGSDDSRFLVLAGYIGDAANMLSEARLDVSGQLANAGTYALAWAAQIIEEEDK